MIPTSPPEARTRLSGAPPGALRRRFLRAALAGSLALALATPVRAEVSLDRALLHDEGGYVPSFAAGDFDGDGKADLAAFVDQNGPRRITLSLSNGDGTFRRTVDTPTDTGRLEVRAADVTGDGKLDLLGVNRTDGSSYLLAGDGAGGLGPVTPGTRVDPALTAWTTTDVNGDGKADLLALKPGTTPTENGALLVTWGRGDGTFDSKATTPVEPSPAGLVAADLNGDGRPDLAVAITPVNKISVLLNDGGGGFGPRADYEAGREPLILTAIDLAGDGRPELVVGDEFGNLAVLPNRGDGTLGAGKTLPRVAFDKFAFLAPGDFDGDGRVDLAAGTDGGNYGLITLFPGNGDGTFRPHLTFPTGFPGLVGGAVGDLDGDGDDDVAFLKSGMDGVGVRLARPVLAPPPPAVFTEPVPYGPVLPSPSSLVPVQALDANGDTHLDLVMTGEYAPYVTVLLGQGDGTFDTKREAFTTRPPTAARAADLNGDGRADLIAAVPGEFGTSGRLLFFLSRANGTYAPQADQTFDLTTDSIAVADFNGDGWPDVAVPKLNFFGDSTVPVLLNQGDGSLSSPAEFPAGFGPNAIAAGDFNGDGKTDLMVANYDIQTNNRYASSRLLPGNGDGTFGEGIPTLYDPDRGDPTRKRDFNGDGIQDSFAPLGNATGPVEIRLGRADGTYGPPRRFEVSPFNLKDVIGDFNDDGKLDLIFEPEHTNGLKTFVPGYGDGSFSPNAYPPYLGQVLAGDFDEDGRLDLAGGAGVYLNRTPGLAVTAPAWAKAGDQAEILVLATRPVTAPPALRISGPCIEEDAIELSRVGETDVYRGAYTVPEGATDCTATLSAEAVRVTGSAPVSEIGSMQIDRTPPTVEITVDTMPGSNGIYTSAVSGSVRGRDGERGTASLHYAVNRPQCAPASPEACTEVSTTFTDLPLSASFHLREEGRYTVYGFVTDFAGNVSAPRSIELTLDLQPPTAKEQAVTTTEDTPVEITLTGTDTLAGPLTYTVSSSPQHGTLGPVRGDKITYTPNPDYFGTDRFSFTANDGAHTGPPASVTVKVAPAPDPPVAEDAAFTVFQDRPRAVLLTAGDPDGGALTWDVAARPAHGSLSGGAPDLVYTPEPGYTGPDAFSFKVSDGVLESGVAGVSLNVIAPLLTIGRASVVAGEPARLSVSVAESAGKVSEVTLSLKVYTPAGAPPLTPAFSLGAATQGWRATFDPQHPWRITLAGDGGTAAPGEILVLSVGTSAPAPPGSRYEITAEEAILRVEMPEGPPVVTDVADRTAPGELLFRECEAREKGDVTGEGAVDVVDVVAVLRLVVGLDTVPNACIRATADVNCDGELGVADAVLLLKNIVLGIPLPVCG